MGLQVFAWLILTVSIRQMSAYWLVQTFSDFSRQDGFTALCGATGADSRRKI